MALMLKRDVPFLAFIVAALALRMVPRGRRPQSHVRAGRALGRLWQKIDSSGVELVRRNLQHVLGDRLTGEELEAALQRVFENVALGKIVNDVLPETSLEEFERLVVLEGEERLRRALGRDRGVVLLGAHFGLQTYAILAYLCREGYDVVGVLGEEVLPEKSWVYDRIVHPFRRRPRLHLDVLTPTGRPQRSLVETLETNRILLILGDVLDEEVEQLGPPYVLPAPFFDGVVPLKTGPFRLARWADAPVLTFWALPSGDRFRLVIDEPLRLSPDSSARGLAEDLAGFTARLEARLEAHPGDWVHWRHPRLTELVDRSPRPAVPSRRSDRRPL